MSQAATLTVFLISIVVYAAGILVFRRRRAWLTYYVTAALGLALILIFGARLVGISDKIEGAVTYTTSMLAPLVGVNARFLGQNAILVKDALGWVVLETNIECSALIESSILLGLILYYPGFSKQRKAATIGIGLIVTIIANLMRMLIITWFAATMGRQAIFWGHAVVGRLFFFVVIIALYWFILTRPTVVIVGQNVESQGANGTP